jgi:hypothetical protein
LKMTASKRRLTRINFGNSTQFMNQSSNLFWLHSGQEIDYLIAVIAFNFDFKHAPFPLQVLADNCVLGTRPCRNDTFIERLNKRMCLSGKSKLSERTLWERLPAAKSNDRGWPATSSVESKPLPQSNKTCSFQISG